MAEAERVPLRPITMSFPENAGIQEATKQVLFELAVIITDQSTERTIADAAVRMLAEKRFPNTWYYDCPALVLLGNRTCESVSGKAYKPSDVPIGLHGLITVDLSPADGRTWGDCARAYYIENGVAIFPPIDPDFVDGHRVQMLLHAQMKRIVSRKTTFGELFDFADEVIRREGYENLDFLGNLGHSIAHRLEDRSYIISSNHRLLSEVLCFAFEPHIRKVGGVWGFKHENIYFFDENDMITEL